MMRVIQGQLHRARYDRQTGQVRQSLMSDARTPRLLALPIIQLDEHLALPSDPIRSSGAAHNVRVPAPNEVRRFGSLQSQITCCTEVSSR